MDLVAVEVAAKHHNPDTNKKNSLRFVKMHRNTRIRAEVGLLRRYAMR